MESKVGTLDYVIFALVFVLSAAIGFYSVFADRKKKNSMDNFHRANRRAHPLPVSLSLSVTIFSGATLIGVPVDVYMYGTMIFWMALGMLFAVVNTAHVFLPVFYNLNQISTFEYIQLRFGREPRILASVTYVCSYFFIHGFVVYAPCLAFQAMTNVSLYPIMAATAAVCILYTLLGGMKAVVWADTLQFFIIVAGLLAILIVTVREVGGIDKVWKTSDDFQRIEFFNFSPDPKTRHSFWSMTIGFGLLWTFAYGTNQATIQRASSLPTLKQAQLAVWLNFPGLLILVVLSVLNGLAMFAFYQSCDPVTAGRIEKKDQLLPLLSADLLTKTPGLAGLVLAVLFSGSLSTISSGLSAYSAVIVEDIIKSSVKGQFSESVQILLSRIVVVINGTILFAVGVGLSKLDGLIYQALNSFASVLAGPMLGLFISGMIFPWTNVNGVCSGFVVSVAIVIWLLIGALSKVPPQPHLPLSTTGCTFLNSTNYLNSTTTTTTGTSLSTAISTSSVISNTTSELFAGAQEEEETALHNFYSMSYNWYGGFGMLVYLAVSLFISFITGPTNPRTVDSKLMCPLFYRLCPFLPHRYRKKLLFGVHYDSDEIEVKPKEKDKATLENGVSATPNGVHQKETGTVWSTNM